MTTLQTFFKNNMESIIAMVVLIITLLTLFSVAGIDFNPHRHDHIEKIVTIESYINPTKSHGSIDNEGSSRLIKMSTKDDSEKVMLMDDTEETGSPASVSFSEKQKVLASQKKQKQDHVFSLLKKKDKVFQKTLGDHKGIDSICAVHTKTKDTESNCNKLKYANCNTTNCCVWLTHDNTCSAGNKKGPTYLEKNNKTVNKSQYYHMGKCYGSKCPE